MDMSYLINLAEFYSKKSDSRELIDGKLKRVRNNCVFVALQSYKERHEEDKNPVIAKMQIKGKGGLKTIDHYYYRSDNWIEQKFLIPRDNLEVYVGPANEADPVFYGNFKRWESIMEFLPEKIDSFLEILTKNNLNRAILL